MPDQITTPTLRIAYQAGGPADGPPILLLHGWPDDPHTYDKIAPVLNQAGLRTVAPWLRGFGATQFLSPDTMRSAEMVAFAQDAIDLMDALKIGEFAVVGHDWGARIAYALAILWPQRVTRVATIAVGWQPGRLPTPGLEQASRYWYQWFMRTERGAAEVRRDPKAFARFLWEKWSPPGWLTDAEFDATAASFENPDWPDITVHSYRVRWEEAPKDKRYAELDSRVLAATSINVPTLVIQGGADSVALPQSTEGQDRHFSRGYARHVIPGVGHFPSREAPGAVSRLLLEFLHK